MEDLLFYQTGKKWSIEEDQQLITEYNTGNDIIEISQIHKRLPNGIATRLVSLNVIEELLDLVENKERFEIIYCDENNKYMDILWRLLNISGTFIVGDNSSSRIFLEKHVGSYLIINKSDNFSFIKKLT